MLWEIWLICYWEVELCLPAFSDSANHDPGNEFSANGDGSQFWKHHKAHLSGQLN